MGQRRKHRARSPPRCCFWQGMHLTHAPAGCAVCRILSPLNNSPTPHLISGFGALQASKERVRAAASARSKALWSDPAFREKTVAGFRASVERRGLRLRESSPRAGSSRSARRMRSMSAAPRTAAQVGKRQESAAGDGGGASGDGVSRDDSAGGDASRGPGPTRRRRSRPSMRRAATNSSPSARLARGASAAGTSGADDEQPAPTSPTGTAASRAQLGAAMVQQSVAEAAKARGQMREQLERLSDLRAMRRQLECVVAALDANVRTLRGPASAAHAAAASFTPRSESWRLGGGADR